MVKERQRQSFFEHWHLDPVLLLGMLLLGLASMVILYSAGSGNTALLWRQGTRLLLGLGIMALLAQVSPQSIERWSPQLYAAGMVLLVLVLISGIVGKGAQRWLTIGPLRFQPAEFMKLAMPMMIAWIATRRPLPLKFANLVLALLAIALPAALVIIQPDLGTAVLIMVSGVLVLFLAGMNWRLILTALMVTIAAAAAVWQFNFLHGYQRKRILTLFDPWSDPLGAGYHIIQSIIAVGSGGLSGKGWMMGSQSQLQFIPERQTDFIFAVFAEDFGLFGVLGLFLLYLVIVIRSLNIAYYSRDSYSRLLGGSLALTFFFYAFVNIGMVTGILPVVGVPLPLISYGGTSMVTLMAGFGVLMSIHTHKKFIPR